MAVRGLPGHWERRQEVASTVYRGRSRSTWVVFPTHTRALDILISRKRVRHQAFHNRIQFHRRLAFQNAVDVDQERRESSENGVELSRARTVARVCKLGAGVSQSSRACVVRDRHAQRRWEVEVDQDDKERKSDRLCCVWEPPGRGRHHREAATCGSAGVLTLSQGSFHAQHTGLYV